MSFWVSGMLAVAFVLSSIHPLHVSVTEIEFDEKDHSLEIMMRIFVEDLELAIRHQQKDKNLTISKATDSDKLVSDYITSHFRISLDNKVQKTHYLGYEIEGDALIAYIEVSNVKKWKVIEMMNNSIMEIHDDQSNIINVTVRDEVKSLRLVEGSASGKLTF